MVQSNLHRRLTRIAFVTFAAVSARALAAPGDTVIVEQVATLASFEQGSAHFISPTALAFDSLGNVIVADAGRHALYKISRRGAVSLLAGGVCGYADGAGERAQFFSPVDVAVAPDGSILVLDGNRLRRVTPKGAVTTLAGGERGYADGQGRAAMMNFPVSLAIDRAGNAFVADAGNGRLRLVSPTGAVATVLRGDNAGGAPVEITRPASLAVDRTGALIVVDRSRCVVRRFVQTPKGFVADTLAYRCAELARLRLVGSIAVDVWGNLIALEDNGKTLRKISPAGALTTIVAKQPKFAISALALDASGGAFIANPLVRGVQKIILP